MRPDRLWLVVLVGCAETSSEPVEVLATTGCADPGPTVSFDPTWLAGDAAEAHRFTGAGVAVGDLDGDDRLDLVLPGPTRLRVLRQAGPAGSPTFEALPLAAELEALGADATGAAVADVDRDGDLDVWVVRFGPPDALLLNDGAGGFTVADDPLIGVPHHGQSVAFVDLDGDSWLDVVVSGHGPVEAEEGQTAIDGPADPTRVLRQQPSTPGTLGAFEDRTMGLDSNAHAAYTFVATPTHLDGDGRVDLLLANDFPVYRPNLALRQTNRGGFALAPESGLHVRAAGMGVGVHDVNGDGWDDYVLPVWNRVVYLRSTGGAEPRWVEAQAQAGLALEPIDPARVGWGADFGDLDADGFADLVVGFGHLDTVGVRTAGGASADNGLTQSDYAFAARADGAFDPAAWELDDDGVTRGVLLVDLDHDGWLDVIRRDLDGPTRIDWSQCGPGHTLSVVLEPLADAVGATVTVGLTRPDGADARLARTVRAGGISLASGGPPELHFGLGPATEVHDLEVTWADGTSETVEGPISADLRIRLRR